LGSFDKNAVEDFHLIEVVALRFEEPLSLIHGRLHYRAIVIGERDLGPIAACGVNLTPLGEIA
jgi:hypothetical protein